MTTTENDDFDALYGSKYLGVADLKGETPRRRIGKVEVHELKQKDGTARKKYVLFLEKEDKLLVVNKTNAVKLAGAYGKNHAGWPGNFIELYSEPTSFGPGVRVRPLRRAATPDKLDPDLDDAIPF